MIKDTHLCYEAGDIVIFTCGEYSDYRYKEIMVFLKDCELKKLAQEYYNSQNTNEEYWFDADNFLAWLIINECAAPVSHSEIWLGASGRLYKDFDVEENLLDIDFSE